MRKDGLNILTIANPASGTGKTDAQVLRLIKRLNKRGHRVELFFTSRSGDARRRAQLVDSTVDAVIVSGGDGTVNDVVNGLTDLSIAPVLHLPTGTANMLAHDLGIPKDLDALVDLLESGSTRQVDVGSVADHKFLLLATAGIDAAVVREMERYRTDGLGFANYLVPVINTLLKHESMHFTVKVDDDETLHGEHVMVLKSRNYGRYFSFTKNARLDAGYFEVVVFSNTTIAAIAQAIMAGLVGALSYLPDVVRRTCTRVRVEAAEPAPVEVDGDYIGLTPVDIEMLPTAVRMIAPQPEDQKT